jgi:hypothetical protein
MMRITPLLLSSALLALCAFPSCNLEPIAPVIPEKTWEVKLGSGTYDVGYSVLIKDSITYIAALEKNGSGVNELVLYKLDSEGNIDDRHNFGNTTSCISAYMSWGSNNDLVVVAAQLGYKVMVSWVNLSSLTPGISKTYTGLDPQGVVVTSNGEVVISGQHVSSSFVNGIIYLDYSGRILRLSATLDSLWMREYFDQDEGSLYRSVQSPSFEIIGTGSRYASGGSDRSGLIYRTSSTGLLWNQVDLGDASHQESLRDIIRDANGNYTVAGIASSNNSTVYDPYLARVDNDLVLITQKTGYPALAATNEIIYDIDASRDGGYILAGYIWANGSEADFLLLKVDENLNYQWHKTFGGPYRDYAFEVEPSSDGGYVITGFTSVNESDYDVFVVKTNSKGETN